MQYALGFSLLAPYKLGRVTYTCKSSAWEVEARGSDVHGHPWLHSKFEASLSYRKPWSQNKTKKKGKREQKKKKEKQSKNGWLAIWCVAILNLNSGCKQLENLKKFLKPIRCSNPTPKLIVTASTAKRHSQTRPGVCKRHSPVPWTFCRLCSVFQVYNFREVLSLLG